MPNVKKAARDCRSRTGTAQGSTKQSTPAAAGIAARLMEQPTPVCDCSRCAMDYCDCSEEQQGTVTAPKAEYFRG